MKLLKKRDRKRGFTMVELMVVVAILAALVLLVAPKVMGNSEKARIRTFESNYRSLVSEVTMDIAEGKKGAISNDATTGAAVAFKDKPTGATYTFAGNYDGTATANTPKLTAKYGNYELLYNFTTGTTEAKNKPEGASF